MTATPGSKSNRRGRISYTAALAILEQALDSEEHRQFDDTAVKGGFDRLLARFDSEHRLPPGSPLAKGVHDLLRITYGSLSPAGRTQWVTNLRTMLGREKDRIAAGVAAVGRSTSAASDSSSATRSGGAHPPRTSAIATAARTLEAPVTLLSGVNRTVAAKLSALGISTVRELLYHFPHRYDDFSRFRSISALVPGEQQTLVATVWSAAERQMGRRRKGTELIVGDTTGNLRVVFFNQPYLAARFRTGAHVVLSGKVAVFNHQRQMDSPEWELLEPRELDQAIHTARLVPIYPLTAGLSARTLRRIIHAALEGFEHLIEETLPEGLRQHYALMPLREAIRQIHYPDDSAKAEQARRRLAFEELLTLQLAVLSERQTRIQTSQAVGLPLPAAMYDAFLSSLPFALTAAQRRVTDEILADVALERPMARLLQGDVGSGKTVVAATALLAAVANGFQAVLMAPTEILAEQHFETLRRVFGAEPYLNGPGFRSDPTYLGRPIRIGLIHGGLGARAKARAQAALADGEIEIVVGTQALIQEGISIPRLGLAVVDEQHRFGVMQRAALRNKGLNSHLLVMTATPIPRTLALTLYGDLELSTIDEMPPGRVPAVTKFTPAEERSFAYRFIRDEIDAGRQAFVICPLVEESESLEVRAAVEEYERLQELDVFEGIDIALLHGRMKSREKDAVMRGFSEGHSAILVSTAVVEVGIDVPNASVILIEGADRFGLAQLHQFRGRVGRGAHQSYCLLVSDNPSADAAERLQLMEQTSDGFELAEADLRLRGPGEYFGTRQSGLPDLRVARITDVELLRETRDEARVILGAAPGLDSKEWSSIREHVKQLRGGGGEVS